MTGVTKPYKKSPITMEDDDGILEPTQGSVYEQKLLNEGMVSCTILRLLTFCILTVSIAVTYRPHPFYRP